MQLGLKYTLKSHPSEQICEGGYNENSPERLLYNLPHSGL